ncbi:MAG: SHOCT domain-containing protein [Microthrixaceae bacterium]
MRRRAGRPGLVGTMARTAVIAGTATAVSGGVARRQQAKAQQSADAQAYQEQEAAPAPAPAPAAAPEQDTITQLKELAALKDQGILTEEEFAAQKAKILGS